MGLGDGEFSSEEEHVVDTPMLDVNKAHEDEGDKGDGQEEDFHYEIEPPTELNNYEPETNPVIKILDSRTQNGNYSYFVQTEDGSKEWRTCEDCAHCVDLICDYVSKRVKVTVKEEEEELPKDKDQQKVQQPQKQKQQQKHQVPQPKKPELPMIPEKKELSKKAELSKKKPKNAKLIKKCQKY